MALRPFSDTIEWSGTSYKILLASGQTDGRLSIFESLDQPGYGPPRHIHKAQDETFYIFAGEVEFWQEGRSTLCGPGDVVFIERGRELTFRVMGELPARMMTVMTPGGFEGFFVEMADGHVQIPMDMGKIVAVGAKYDLAFTGPAFGAWAVTT